MKGLKKFLVWVLALIGALNIIVIIVSIILVTSISKEPKSLPKEIILEINLEEKLIEYLPEDPIARALKRKVSTIRGVVEALKVASNDSRVKGLVANIGSTPMGLAVIQEIRDAITKFGKSGKFTVAYSETFGEFGHGSGAYYLASSFDEIYLQPSGDLNLTGLIYECPFLSGTMEKLYLEPRMDHRKEYKNAMNIFTETKYTAPHKEAIETLMNSQFDQMVKAITQSRNLTEEKVLAFADSAPFTAQQAINANLVDGLLYRDQVYELVKAKAKGADLLYLDKYIQRTDKPYRHGPTIALIYGVGNVHRGPSQYSVMNDSPSMGSETISAAFRSAAADKKVKAIVFRVDSPGGSYVASDTIWREMAKAKQKGKPVIVSMGNVAGSGGYFVAMEADKIVAQPGTITGSIGVLTGKLLTRRFWQEKLGITWDDVRTSQNSAMWTGTHDYTPHQWQKLQDFLDRAYEDFTTKVAHGRKLDKEKVLKIAKGRIWTGEDAQKIGLVDELGGFDTALKLARTEAGLEPDADITLTVFPKPKKTIELLLNIQPNSSEPETTQILVVQQLLQQAKPVYELIQKTGLVEEKDILRMVPLETEW